MKRKKYSLSHYKLLTMDMGNLIPVSWYETLPGDTIQQSSSALIRVSPLLSPVMHPVMVRIHHFYVPYRLLWEDFEDFITGGPDGTSVPVRPYKNATVTEGSLHDYLGIPPGTTGIQWSCLPHRAYQLIWNEFYRDQDLASEAGFDTSSGYDGTTSTSIQKVCWEKDYFTTSRPWTQKGDPVYIPLFDSSVPVSADGNQTWFNDGTNDRKLQFPASGITPEWSSATSADLDATLGKAADPNATGLEVDLTAATGIPVDDLRLALGIQKYEEARAKYGSRYTEYLRYLGVRPSDGRLQRPEYLGGGRQTIQFSEVLSTDGSNTGEMYGHGISAMRTPRFRRFFDEHGLVMSLMSVIPKTIYTQGLHRKYLRTTKEDYFQKELINIGQQEVYNKEVYTLHSSPDDIFGYQQRYDEYRSHPSSISGEFHTTLDHWHYSRIFASDPSLNSTFVQATPTKRVNASSGTDCLYVMANHSIQARRPIPRMVKP